MVLTLMLLRPLIASSRCKRLLYWILVHNFIAVLTVVTAIAFIVGLFPFIAELDGLGGDLFTLAVVDRALHRLRVATHDYTTI